MAGGEATVEAAVPRRTGRDWSLFTRVGFRFACIYWPLFCLSDFFPTVIVVQVGRHLFGLTGEAATPHFSGSGDKALDYVQVFCAAALALAATLVWSAVSEWRGRRREYGTLYAWLRLLVRFDLSYVLLLYGFYKVFVIQFSPPGLAYLTAVYGESSPMRVLWSFMAASVPYTIFAGVAEVVPGVLLFFRRTTALGALLGAGVMLNVVLLNFCYDVPVKLFSLHLLAQALFLLLPDAAGLWRLFFLGQSASLPGWWLPPWQRRPLRIASRVLQVVVVLALFYFTVGQTYPGRYRGAGERSPLYGLWVRDTVEAAAPDKVWNQISFERPTEAGVRYPDGHREWVDTKFDLPGQTVTFPKAEKPSALQWTRSADGTLTLAGKWLDEPLTTTLHRTDADSYLLQTRGFHWVQEYPYNRSEPVPVKTP